MKKRECDIFTSRKTTALHCLFTSILGLALLLLMLLPLLLYVLYFSFANTIVCFVVVFSLNSFWSMREHFSNCFLIFNNDHLAFELFLAWWVEHFLLGVSFWCDFFLFFCFGRRISRTAQFNKKRNKKKRAASAAAASASSEQKSNSARLQHQARKCYSSCVVCSLSIDDVYLLERITQS